MSQLNEYLAVAEANGYDALLTVSSQLAPYPGVHPLADAVESKHLRKVGLHHLSWSDIHTEVIVEEERHRVRDRDQAQILHEYRRYLESSRAGALEFQDMGPSWVRVREGVARNTLKAVDPGAAEIVGRYAQLMSFTGMHLQRHGVDVRPLVRRSDGVDPRARLVAGLSLLEREGKLMGALTIPSMPNPVNVVVDLRAMRCECSLTISAPANPRPTTRVTWLTRQLVNVPSDLTVEADVAYARQSGSPRRFSAVQENPTALLENPKANVRTFTLRLNRPIGTKRWAGQGSFIDSVLKLVDTFYLDVVTSLTLPTPRDGANGTQKHSSGRRAAEPDLESQLVGEASVDEAFRQSSALPLQGAVPNLS